MVTFKDGPAQGAVLELRRAPLYLRVVRCPDGEFDALDQLQDSPKAGEKVWAYRRVGAAGWVHLDYRDKKGRRCGKTFATAEYEQVTDQPVENTLWVNIRWREWAEAQVKTKEQPDELQTGG